MTDQVRIIKWEGEAPKVWKWRARWPFLYRDIPEPIGHPQCVEIVEIKAGERPVTTFKRGQP